MERNSGDPNSSDAQPKAGLLAVNSSPFKAKRTISYKDKQGSQAQANHAPASAATSDRSCLKCELL